VTHDLHTSISLVIEFTILMQLQNSKPSTQIQRYCIAVHKNYEIGIFQQLVSQLLHTLWYIC